MREDRRLAAIALLVGDAARTNILTRCATAALTAGERAHFDGVSPHIASGDLASSRRADTPVAEVAEGGPSPAAGRRRRRSGA